MRVHRKMISTKLGGGDAGSWNDGQVKVPGKMVLPERDLEEVGDAGMWKDCRLRLVTTERTLRK